MSNNENIQYIDNDEFFKEKTDNELSKIEAKYESKENLVALWILQSIDKQIPEYDIDLAFDSNSKKYYFVASDLGTNNYREKLTIPLNIQQVEEVGEILAKIFNKNIVLSWDLHSRFIHEDTWKPDGIEEWYASTVKNDLTKWEIEELFTFTMKTRNIAMEDWELSWPICKWAYDNTCKQELWNF